MRTEAEIGAIVMEVVAPFVKSGAKLDLQTRLMDGGHLDSVSLINILLQLESRLGLTLSAADLSFDHFQDCASLARALKQRANG